MVYCSINAISWSHIMNIIWMTAFPINEISYAEAIVHKDTPEFRSVTLLWHENPQINSTQRAFRGFWWIPTLFPHDINFLKFWEPYLTNKDDNFAVTHLCFPHKYIHQLYNAYTYIHTFFGSSAIILHKQSRINMNSKGFVIKWFHVMLIDMTVSW